MPSASRPDASATRFVLAALITLFGGYLVKIYAWKSILGATGILNQALMAAGILDEPAPWLHLQPRRRHRALVHFLLPFAILPIYAALRNVSETTLEAGRDLGASPLQTFWRIVLPQCRSGLLAAFSITFLLAAGDYVTPLLLGGSGGSMLGQFIALEFSTRFNWPAGAAMSYRPARREPSRPACRLDAVRTGKGSMRPRPTRLDRNPRPAACSSCSGRSCWSCCSRSARTR